MKLLKVIGGVLSGVAGICLLIVTLGYASVIDASILLPYLVVGLLYVSYKLVFKEEK